MEVHPESSDETQTALAELETRLAQMESQIQKPKQPAMNESPAANDTPVKRGRVDPGPPARNVFGLPPTAQIADPAARTAIEWSMQQIQAFTEQPSYSTVRPSVSTANFGT